MSTGLRLRPSVVAAKARLVEGREKLRQRHLAGTPGVQIGYAMTDLVDAILLDLLDTIFRELGHGPDSALRDKIAIVAHGGYGRRDLAPYSDVDLMILYLPAVYPEVVPVAERFTRDVYDAGLSLGHSVRTAAQACELAFKDATICTALMESRLLSGSSTLFAKFMRKFQTGVRRRQRRLLQLICKARAEERTQFGDTIYLLEPNLKRSPGGLRDLHLLRWVGFVRYGSGDPESLQLRGELSTRDFRAVRRSSEFLLRLRNEVHFHAEKAHDVLDRAEQLRVAAALQYEGSDAILPVERFMRDYFRATTDISHITSHFVAGAQPGQRWRAALAPLLSHQVERDFLVGPLQIMATRRGRAKLANELNEALRLADLANLYDKRIANSAAEIIREAAPTYPPELSSEASQHFLSLLSQPARLGELLRTLHDLRVLERVIPEYTHARCLLQFNEYHRYTVDEHCIRAVERATDLKHDQTLLGHVYRGIKQKRTLHLALLIHDLGKGHVEDHSEVGLRIAADTARRLRLPMAEGELLKFLVHKHLNMAHLAFRRDTSDEQLIVRFAVEVGSPEALQMLFALTVADVSAVGPGVWNRWKGEVLSDLYQRTMRHLSGNSEASSQNHALDTRKRQVRELLRDETDRTWFEKEIESLPNEYLNATSPQQVVDELRELHQLQPGQVITRARYLSDRHAVEYTVATHESVAPGVFHRLTGAFSSQGLQILSAQINTLAEGLVLDRFWVHDLDFEGEPPASRCDDVSQKLIDSLRAPESAQPTFRRTWLGRPASPPSVLPTRVRIDNNTSDRFTIIDVFAADRTGLLYRVTRSLYELGLSVSLAKIATHVDQVLDVFYVTDHHGDKIVNESRVQQIQHRLLEDIEELARQDTSAVGSR